MQEPDIREQIQKRRTFAIISHPDAGKTTLTEKLLLYGGAIRLAGTVKGRKAQKFAVSDWMEIEKQRGISVTSSVMQFEYDNCCINILDTPGHQDFSEDTYRTLMAADSAVMLIDAAKGVEEQTKKLFQVCRQRRIPVFTFVNKIDRYGRDPFELMDELEKVLGIHSCPMNWPVGLNGSYKGVYNRQLQQIELFEADGSHGSDIIKSTVDDYRDEKFARLLEPEAYAQLCHDIELLDMAGNSFDQELVQKGELSPMFFGSALTNFGVRAFLEEFLKLAPPPAPRMAKEGIVFPEAEGFSAFVFKIQANMNPAHRDRLAFVRICSGKFSRGMTVTHKQSGKTMALTQPQQFVAQERTIVDEAYPGDVVGLFDPGIFAIGDTVCEPGLDITFEDFPVFPPEHFAKVQAKTSLKRKHFIKGITQLGQEGAIQIFQLPHAADQGYVIGVVGQLQFEILSYRLKYEYGVDVEINQLPYAAARWLVEDPQNKQPLKYMEENMLVMDRFERPVVLFVGNWQMNWTIEQNPQAQFLVVPPREWL